MILVLSKPGMVLISWSSCKLCTQDLCIKNTIKYAFFIDSESHNIHVHLNGSGISNFHSVPLTVMNSDMNNHDSAGVLFAKVFTWDWASSVVNVENTSRKNETENQLTRPCTEQYEHNV